MKNKAFNDFKKMKCLKKCECNIVIEIIFGIVDKSKVVQHYGILINNDIRHHSGQNVVDSQGLQQLLTTVMTNIVVDKGTDTTEPLSICFLPQYSMPKKVFISERHQNHNSKKDQALSITFSQYDWFISQNITLRDKLTQA